MRLFVFISFFISFWATVTSNFSPYATGPLSCQSVTLAYCGQTVGWIKTPLGTEAGLGPGDIVLDGDPVPTMERGTASPTFRPMSILAKRSPSQQLLCSCYTIV